LVINIIKIIELITKILTLEQCGILLGKLGSFSIAASKSYLMVREEIDVKECVKYPYNIR